MKKEVVFWVVLLSLAIASTMPLAAKEFVIFDDELLFGMFTAHDGGFEIGDEEPFEGKKCMSRELIAGEWAWITGIENMQLDLTGIEFDDAFLEFYIDSGDTALDYIELRVGGAGWNPDSQEIIITDAVEGYEQIKIPLKDFFVKQLGGGCGGFGRIYRRHEQG